MNRGLTVGISLVLYKLVLMAIASWESRSTK
jgi:hypothetical protein